MSRFFVQDDEDEEINIEEKETKMEEIKEEDEPKEEVKMSKRQMKKLKQEENLKKQQENEDTVNLEEAEKGKKKKGKQNKNAMKAKENLLKVKQLVNEKKEIQEKKFLLFTIDYRKIHFEDLKDFSKEYNKKILKLREREKLKKQGLLLTKKERMKKEKADLARQIFEEQLEKQKELGINAETVVKKPLLKNNNKKKKKQKEKELNKKKEENNINTEINKEDNKCNDNEGEEDDWENMIDEAHKLEEAEKENKVNNNTEIINDQKDNKNNDIKDAKLEALKEESKNIDPKSLFYLPNCKYRCPIICILGHVDTGKTKLLDRLRNTNVQNNEAGGITQQIGASFFPQYKIIEEVSKVTDYKVNVEIPGLLIIDTPGHESFGNLRSRGSSLADFAILVVDIMHGLENQTLESINLLKSRNTPFVIALNKIDRTKDWKSKDNGYFFGNYLKQDGFAKMIFENNYKKIVTELAKQEINVCLYNENTDDRDYYPVVPTSAITGEGICDLLSVIVNLNQKYLNKEIQVKHEDKDFKATVMEIKKIEGLGSTIDVVLVDGILRENDNIVLSGLHGPIVTTIRALLTPHPMKEMRVKAEYIHHKEVKGSMGIKIVAVGLETALAGSSLFKYTNLEQLEEYKSELKSEIKKIKKTIKLKPEGVGVAASTLGSLEALLIFLKDQKIPVSHICIGEITKDFVTKVLSPFISEDNKCKKREYATILAFDVKPLPEAQKFADEHKIKIFTANIIYHLFDSYIKHKDEHMKRRKINEGKSAVFPSQLKIVQIFNKKDPIIIGLDVEFGILRVGTPICLGADKNGLLIGKVESIQKNHKEIQIARKKDGSIAVKIKVEGNIQGGKNFTELDTLYSKLSRKSIDLLKEHFRDEMTKEDWDLVRKLKVMQNIN